MRVERREGAVPMLAVATTGRIATRRLAPSHIIDFQHALAYHTERHL